MSEDRDEHLSVRLHGIHCGIVSGDPLRPRFTYDPDYLFHRHATPLSLSVRLKEGPQDIAAWIDGLLPDNDVIRSSWADAYGAPTTRPLDLLATPIGADCAGAVQFGPIGADISQTSGGVKWVNESDIAEWIREVREDWDRGIGIGGSPQFSLGGAQAKHAIRYDNQRWGVPSGDEPTTHIIKPGLPNHPDGDLVEHLCQTAARGLGLQASRTEIRHFEDQRALIVERYDRRESDGNIYRIHQEDFCQALAVPPNRKYQRDGGPTPSDMTALITAESSMLPQDREAFCDALIYNWVIGATDGHSKNYSLLLHGPTVRLAPLYDLISYLPYLGRMPTWKLRTAMRIGRDYRLSQSDKTSAWHRFSESIGLDPARVHNRISEMVRAAPDVFADARRTLTASDAASPSSRLTVDRVAERCQELEGTFKPKSSKRGTQSKSPLKNHSMDAADSGSDGVLAARSGRCGHIGVRSGKPCILHAPHPGVPHRYRR